MRIAAAVASAALFAVPFVAPLAHADNGETCSGRGVTMRCHSDDPNKWPLVLPNGYRGSADQNGSCGAFAVSCKPPCNMMNQLDGQLVPNPKRGMGEWCSDTGS